MDLSFFTAPEFSASGIEIPGSRKKSQLDNEMWFGQSGSLVQFKKNHATRPINSFDRDDYLKHHSTPLPPPSSSTNTLAHTTGLSSTKFKVGFDRKPESSINQTLTRDSEMKYMQERLEVHAAGRKTRLSEHDCYNGFNPITGEASTKSTQVDRRRNKKSWLMDEGHTAKRNNGSTPSDELQRIGNIILRDSASRFHGPHFSGDNHDLRQSALVHEGLLKPKYSSVIGIGRNDVTSYGVEDCFSKSLYDRNSGSEGLHESTLPGRFTPRKTGIYDNIPGGSLMSKLSCSKRRGGGAPSPSSTFNNTATNTAPSTSTGTSTTSKSYHSSGGKGAFVPPMSSRGTKMEAFRREVEGLS